MWRVLIVVAVVASVAPEARAADKGSKAQPAAKPPKARVHTFGAMDVEGKLRTPQLLYFLNRVKLELDTTAQQKRSFLPELEKSADAKGL